MGIICELYRIDDDEINRLKKMKDDELDEFLDETYGSVLAKKHIQRDTVFSMDKGWAITRFLIQENDPTKTKVLQALNDRFVMSKQVRLINAILKTIKLDDLKRVYDKQKLIDNHVYRG